MLSATSTITSAIPEQDFDIDGRVVLHQLPAVPAHANGTPRPRPKLGAAIVKLRASEDGERLHVDHPRREFFATVAHAHAGLAEVIVTNVRDGSGNEVGGEHVFTRTSQFIGVKTGDRIRFKATLKLVGEGRDHLRRQTWRFRLLRPHRLPISVELVTELLDKWLGPSMAVAS